MTSRVLWVMLTCLVVGVATSEFGSLLGKSDSEINGLLKTLVSTDKAEKKGWSDSNWDQGSCSRQKLRDTKYDPSEPLPDVLPVKPDCGKRQDQDGDKRSLAEFLRAVLDIDGDLDLDLDKKIVGGKVSQYGKWPWQVAVGTRAEGQFCGGSLIDSRWVLCAAHCFEKENWNGFYIPTYIRPCKYNVRLAEHSLTGKSENHIDITPEKIFVHPDYDSDTIKNDIALIKLKKPAPIDAHSKINVVCLPGEDDFFTRRVCTVSGWGDKTGKQDYADVVHHVAVKVISNKACNRLPPYRGQIEDGMMCAGRVKKGRRAGSCQGDSGGPLVCKMGGDRHIQAGIVSWGGDVCGGRKQPGVFSDVKYFMHWIESVINRK